MGFKTPTISEEAYRKLRRLKGKNESFTDVILKLGEGHGDILRYAGAWKDMTNEDATDLAETLRKMWSTWKPEKSAWTQHSS
jgi:predicted CopG family antitoxin